jgi:hypothetical protein
MFSRLTRQFRDEIHKLEVVLEHNERLRALIFRPKSSRTDSASEITPNLPRVEEGCISQLSAYLETATSEKLNWQIHDHCAAFTRMYAAFERFVNDLVAAYVNELPRIYRTYEELPEAISANHRTGVGQILQKIGPSRLFKDLEESAVVRVLASRLDKSVTYELMHEAFLVGRQNYRFDVIVSLFSALGIEDCGKWIVRHKSIADFMRVVRGDADTAQAELQKFVENRNDATHRVVENIIAVDEIKNVGTFLTILAEVLAELVESVVNKRSIELGDLNLAGTVEEVYRHGTIVVARMLPGALSKNAQLIISDTTQCTKVVVESLQMNDVAVIEIELKGGEELGIGLSGAARKGSQLYRPAPPRTAPMQLALDDVMSPPEDSLEIEAPPDSLENSDPVI